MRIILPYSRHKKIIVMYTLAIFGYYLAWQKAFLLAVKALHLLKQQINSLDFLEK